MKNLRYRVIGVSPIISRTLVNSLLLTRRERNRYQMFQFKCR